MELAGKFLLGLAALLAGAAAAAWLVWKTIRKSEDPGRIIFKWIATGVVFAILLAMGATLKGGGAANAFAVPIGAAVFGVVLGIIWAPHLGAALARPFTAFYDGGETELELRPFYSIARAKQKRGHYQEALAEVRKQLDRFPEDFEGWMLMAEIYAGDLKDNSGAQSCVAEILRHQGHSPKNVAFALNRSADWHLEFALDREAATTQLRMIEALFPGTELAHAAAQRIAHMASDQMLRDQKERPRLVLTRHDEYIGLQGQIADPRPAAEEPAQAARRLVEHLNAYPEDVEAREQLVAVYAEHYQRMDLVADQIEQLIHSPGASQKEITKWLNMLADFHVRIGKSREGAEAALRRVAGMFPKSAAAAQAEKRIAYLEIEMRKNIKSHAVKLGSYEDKIGLKGQVPKPRG